MQIKKAAIGGEGNGGIICPEVHYTRDAPAGMALILAYLAQTEKTISQLVKEIPRYYFAKDKVIVKADEIDSIMEKAPSLFSDKKLDYTDGIKIIEESYWIHIRKSGTEPIIRVYVESESQEASQKICRETIERLTKK